MAYRPLSLPCLAAFLFVLGTHAPITAQPPLAAPFNQHVGPRDWPQLGGSPARNNAVVQAVPTEWEFESDRKTGVTPGRNVKWARKLGSQSFGTPVIANGQIYLGTNNGGAYLNEFPSHVDLGCMLCFRAADGEFMWQYSSRKLSTGRVHDWPMQGICSTPVVEGERMWFVSNRGEVVCLDTEGFRDGEDDGLVQDESIDIQSWPHDLSQFKDRDVRGVIRRITSDAKFQWPSSYQIVRGDEEGHLIVNSSKTDRQIYRLEFKDGEVNVWRMPSNEIDSRLAFRTNLLEGLDEGKLSSGLALLLKSHGVKLPEAYTVHVLKPGEHWSIAANGTPPEQGLELEVVGDQLRARKQISVQTPRHADCVWRLDMMNSLGTRQHNMATCSPTIWGDLLFVCTSNGVDESHITIPAPDAPSFICVDKNSGEVIWQDNSPGDRILHGQWSSPAVGMLGGVPQVIFAGGDGYLRSFRADRGANGKPTLLWKFDCNAKDSKWELGGRGTRNNIVATPVIYHGKVFVATGQDPEHGEGPATLWCIDPTRRGDVSPELLLGADGKPAVPNRYQASSNKRRSFYERFADWDSISKLRIDATLRAAFKKAGIDLPDDAIVRAGEAASNEWRVNAKINGEQREWILNRHGRGEWTRLSIDTVREVRVIPNPNSATVWKYDKYDLDHDGEIESHETMHRSIASPVLRNGLLIQADFSGYVHCVDAETGRPHWVADTLAMCWFTPLIAGNHVYVPDEDGDIAIIGLSADPTAAMLEGLDPSSPAKENTMEASIYAAPVVADGVLYIATRNHLFAIEAE